MDAASVRQGAGARPAGSGDSLLAGGELRTRRLTLLLLVAGLAIRALVAAHAPLLPDEAYYWEWSRHLAAGYFDHPPAVAWLIAAGTALAGETPLGVRLGTLVAGTGAAACIVAIARKLGGDGAGFWAALMLLCMPLATPGLAIATTDAPALFAISAALLCIVIALDAAPGSPAATRWWLLAGAAFGCGLLAKLTVGIVGAATGVALLADPSLRRQLRTAGPWLAVAAALALATPLIAWNAGHDWISLRFQLSHGLAASSRGSALARELSLFAGQAALVSPGMFLLGVAAAWSALHQTERVSEKGGRPVDAPGAAFLLAVVGTAVLAFFAYSALRRPVEPNWPSPAFAALIPLVAASSGLTIRRWRPLSAGLGATLVVVALAQLAAPVLPLSAGRDPVARAYGWATLAATADSLRDTIRGVTGGRVWLAADRYQDAAEIAFLARGQPPVFALNLGGRRNQYDLWPSFARSARVGDALVVALDTGAEAGVATALSTHFARASRGPAVALRRAGNIVAVRGVWTFSGWRGSWPRESPGRQ